MLDKYFHQVKANLDDREGLRLKEFVITEKLNKDVDSYNKDLKSPHLEVARQLKMMNKLHSNYIEYVICIKKDEADQV